MVSNKAPIRACPIGLITIQATGICCHLNPTRSVERYVRLLFLLPMQFACPSCARPHNMPPWMSPSHSMDLLPGGASRSWWASSLRVLNMLWPNSGPPGPIPHPATYSVSPTWRATWSVKICGTRLSDLWLRQKSAAFDGDRWQSAGVQSSCMRIALTIITWNEGAHNHISFTLPIAVIQDFGTVQQLNPMTQINILYVVWRMHNFLYSTCPKLPKQQEGGNCTNFAFSLVLLGPAHVYILIIFESNILHITNAHTNNTHGVVQCTCRSYWNDIPDVHRKGYSADSNWTLTVLFTACLEKQAICFTRSHFQDQEQFSNFGWHSSWRIACLWRLWHADVGRFLWITERHHASKLCNRYLEMVQGSRTNLPRLNYQLVIQLAKSSISRLLINASEQWIWHFVCCGRHIQSSARSIKL